MDDDFRSVRWMLWVAGGMVVCGFFLCIRFWVNHNPPGQSIVPLFGWITLLLGVATSAGAVETEDDRLDLLLVLASVTASFLGALVYAFALVFARGLNEVLKIDVAWELVERGPGLILIGFLLGAGASGWVAWDMVGEVVRERFGRGKARQPSGDGGPTKACPRCGNQVPQYAAACQACKSIFPPGG